MWDDVDASSEVELLVRAAAAAAGSDRGHGSVHDRDTGGDGSAAIDWETVLDLTERHGLVPSLDQYLDEVQSLDPPSEVRSAITEATTETRLNNLHLADVLHSLVDAFETASPRVLAVKGPVVAEAAYGSLSGRPFADLDLLTVSDDVPETGHILLDEGFELVTELGPYDLEDADRDHRHVAFPQELKFLGPNGAVVELRHVSHDRFGTATLAIEDLWRERESVDVAGRPVPTLSQTDRLVFLSYHGSKHAWSRLEWLAGLAGVVRRRDVDWEAARRRARERNLANELSLGAFLASDVLDADVPDHVEREARETERVVDAARWVIDQLVEEPSTYPEQIDRQRFCGRLRGDRSKRYVRFATKADCFEYSKLPLPEPLWPTYYVYRPVRLLASQIGTHVPTP